MTWKADLGVVLLFVLFACFQAWHDEYKRADELQAKLDSKPPYSPTVQVNVPSPPPAQVVLQPGPHATPKLQGFAKPYIALADQSIKDGIGITMNVGVVATGIPIKELYFAPYPAILTALQESDFPENERGFHRKVEELIQKQKKTISRENLVGISVSPNVEHTFVTTKSPPPTDDQVLGLMDGHARLYVIVWARWKDENGVSGETEICRRLQAPKSNDLNAQAAVWLACMQ